MWPPAQPATNQISLQRASTGGKIPQNDRESGECRLIQVRWEGAMIAPESENPIIFIGDQHVKTYAEIFKYLNKRGRITIPELAKRIGIKLESLKNIMYDRSKPGQAE